MPSITLTVNSRSVKADVEPQTLLVELLREKLHLTGTHVGCDTSQCGACVVKLGDRTVKSCAVLAVACDGEAVTTIEGLANKDGTLHPMQQAFHEKTGERFGATANLFRRFSRDIRRTDRVCPRISLGFRIYCL